MRRRLYAASVRSPVLNQYLFDLFPDEPVFFAAGQGSCGEIYGFSSGTTGLKFEFLDLF